MPAPEQNEAGVYDAPLQLAAAHMSVESRQLPAPSQTLVLPQAPPPAPHRASALPAARPAQLPSPFTSQAWQAGQLALPQQAPSTQLPLMHWLPPVHAAPFAFNAQLLVAVPWQVNGGTQSPSVVHEVLQLAVPQTYCMQLTGRAGVQLPAPLQDELGVNVEPVQLAEPHDTLVGACAQAPVPVQAPVFPHGVATDVGHCPAGAAAPAGRLVQVPALPETLHAWQVPQAVDAQQTPSTQ